MDVTSYCFRSDCFEFNALTTSSHSVDKTDSNNSLKTAKVVGFVNDGIPSGAS
jgi:hypothetical protein